MSRDRPHSLIYIKVSDTFSAERKKKKKEVVLTLYGYTRVFGIPIFPVGRVSACTKCCFQAGVMTISTLNFDRYSFLSQMN